MAKRKLKTFGRRFLFPCDAHDQNMHRVKIILKEAKNTGGLLKAKRTAFRCPLMLNISKEAVGFSFYLA